MALLQPPPHLKLCTKCIHYYTAHSYGRRVQVCRHPSNVKDYSPVDGLPILHLQTAQAVRDGSCGREALLHETIATIINAAPINRIRAPSLSKNIDADEL